MPSHGSLLLNFYKFVEQSLANAHRIHPRMLLSSAEEERSGAGISRRDPSKIAIQCFELRVDQDVEKPPHPSKADATINKDKNDTAAADTETIELQKDIETITDMNRRLRRVIANVGVPKPFDGKYNENAAHSPFSLVTTNLSGSRND